MKNLKDFGFQTNNKVFVIAEIGINHGGNLENARKLIDSAAKTGADAVKFQTYITEKRAVKNSPIFDILKSCELPLKAFANLKKYSEEKKVEFFSTPFDDESVDCLNSINVALMKIASFDVTNHLLLHKVAKTKKTIILSTGMSNLEEINSAYEILNKETKNIAILHCISAYPTSGKDANLAAIDVLRKNFSCIIGQSDHTNGIEVPILAVAAGAQIIEKHYKIDDNMDCVDSPVSISEIQMKKLINEIRKIEIVFGEGNLGLKKSEQTTKQFRRFSNLK